MSLGCILLQQRTEPGASGPPCNPSYSGGRDQQDPGSKTSQANSSRDPILKNPSQKRAGGVAQGVGPEFKPQYCKNKMRDLRLEKAVGEV
jgi:hypothetical protein